MTAKPFNGHHQETLIVDPLYTEYDLTSISDDDFAKFVLKGGGLDAYCRECKEASVFRIESAGHGFDEKARLIPKYGLIQMTAECSRHAENYQNKCAGVLYFCFYRSGKELAKIGQYPAKAVLDFGSLDPVFDKELDNALRRELGSAIGLHAHGIGIGSFVYLRRIFERLIEEAHTSAKTEEGWDELVFHRSRIPERIKLLSSHLPSRLVETSRLYEILSKGVHELSEEECLRHFDLVQRAILMILKERHEEQEYRKIVKNLGRGINIEKAPPNESAS